MYQVGTITKAHYRGVEGEMPFQTWDKDNALFIDLRTASNRLATVDLSDKQPVLYLGELIEFDNLKLKNLRKFEGWS